MTDSIRSVKGCLGCEGWEDRDSSLKEFIGLLDRDLHGVLRGLKAELDGDLGLLVLRGLDRVTGWMA